MKRVILLVLLLLLSINISLAVPAYPLPYDCGNGIQCVTIGDHNYAESFTVDDEGNIQCPVTFKDGKAFYAKIAQSGHFELPEEPISLDEMSPEQVQKLQDFICGLQEIYEARPTQPEPEKQLSEMWTEERQIANSEFGVGISFEDGEYVFESEVVQEYFDNYHIF